MIQMTRARLRRPGTPEQRDSGPPDLSSLLTQGPPARRQALTRRLTTILGTLAVPDRTSTGRELLAALDRSLTAGGLNAAWLALAVLTGRLPVSSEVRRLARASRLDSALPTLLDSLDEAGQLSATVWAEVEVITGRALVDVHDTARNPLATGIQRVARQAARRWQRDHDVILIGWTDGFTAYRRLSALQSDQALNGAGPGRSSSDSPESTDQAEAADDRVLVPWRCTHLVPELPAEAGPGPSLSGVRPVLGVDDGIDRF